MTLEPPKELHVEKERVEELAEDFSALSNPHRLHLLQLLTRPLYGKEIGEALGMSRQAASRHIDLLQERGFIRTLEGWRETGPVKEYQVVPQRLFALGTALAEFGKLEPEGGPDVRRSEKTITFGSNGDQDLEDGIKKPEEREALEHASLVVASGPEEGEVFPLDGDGPRWTLGRNDDRTFQVDWDPYVSGRHCEIQTDMRGHTLVDAHSFNGTYLNFNRLPKGERAELHVGDIIKIGNTSLVYQEE